uniref:PreC/core protein n=1 Tax=Alewife hepatitis B virus TaxID=3066367 RepID=A0AA49X792_9HEPA|nr:preC/core protein [Alewife hepatitis B virus]WLK26112.1 preC/core protein [Alewife hepatitis B virus]
MAGNAPPPDPFEEWGVTQEVVAVIPGDFYPDSLRSYTLVLAQFHDQIYPGPKRQAGGHYTALRVLIVLWGQHNALRDWMADPNNINDGGVIYNNWLLWTNRNMAYQLQRQAWFHWACLCFGEASVRKFIISLATWTQTPAAYRPPNAPILSQMAEPAKNYIGPGAGSRPTTPVRRAPSRSPSPVRRK